MIGNAAASPATDLAKEEDFERLVAAAFYFSAYADPMEYTGRLFWAEREMANLGIELD